MAGRVATHNVNVAVEGAAADLRQIMPDLAGGITATIGGEINAKISESETAILASTHGLWKAAVKAWG